MRTKSERNLSTINFVADDITDDDVVSKSQIAIAVPGIRTDGAWVDVASARANRWALPIQIIKVGQHRISSFKMLTRIGISSIKESIKNDIMNIIIKYQNTHNISVICHSMGASLFSEILVSIKYKFDKIIFIGSVCHRAEAINISKNCNIFINHCGINDHWPIIAEIARPCKYSSTGTIGFKGPYANEFFFLNNHHSCTQQSHMDNYVIPLLYNMQVEIPLGINARYSTTQIKYVRNFVLILLVIIILLTYLYFLDFF